MKKIIVSSIILITLNSITMATNGFNIEKEITINVSASELWKMIGPGFVEVYKWSSNVDHAEGFGTPEFEGATCSQRVCNVNVKGFSKISERLTKYDKENMNLAYQVMDGMPSFVTLALNDWTVVAINDSTSKLVMQAEFGSKGLMGTMMNGMMRKKMEKTLETVLDDAKTYAETGQISEAKKERVMELERKMSKKAA